MMKIDVLTLFPEMFHGVLGSSMLKKAAEMDAASYQVINFRDFSTQKVKQVDDYPYGGGAGMVLMPQPIFDAVAAVKEASTTKPHVVLLCPQGAPFTQRKAESLATKKHLVFVCGHYEGYDERIRECLIDEEISIGDYVLTGGELAAMVVIDAVVRLLPEVLGNADSPVQDSHSSGLLEHPHYTRPAEFNGLAVPDILLSGHHKNIEEWRMKESLRRTYMRRPDLLEHYEMSDKERQWLAEVIEEIKG